MFSISSPKYGLIKLYSHELSKYFVASRQVSTVGITSLGIDHTSLLGSTIEDIAWQKAGIMKPGSITFTVDQQPAAALEVLKQRASEKKVRLSLWEMKELQSVSLRWKYAVYHILWELLEVKPSCFQACLATHDVHSRELKPLHLFLHSEELQWCKGYSYTLSCQVPTLIKVAVNRIRRCSWAKSADD